MKLFNLFENQTNQVGYYETFPVGNTVSDKV